MNDRRLTDASKTALTNAVKAIESVSAAEIVVAVRGQARPYPEAYLVTTSGATVAALVYQLYAPTEFALHWIVINTAVLAALAALLTWLLPPLRRACVRRSVLLEATRTAAEATFFKRGVRRTADRIGVLVQYCQMERMVEVIADDGVHAAISEDALHALCEAIRAPVVADRGFAAAADALAATAPVFAAHLPVQEGDVNELADEVHHD